MLMVFTRKSEIFMGYVSFREGIYPNKTNKLSNFTYVFLDASVSLA